MVNITIRNPDSRVKQVLRGNAAYDNSSMEEEARLLPDTGVKRNFEDKRLCNKQGLVQNSPENGNPPDDIALIGAIVRNNAHPRHNIPSSYKSDSFPTIYEKRVLLIISGSIAAYKTLDLIRRLKEHGIHPGIVMTQAACKFISPLSVEALCHDKVFTELFNREGEQDVGHIRLAREADLIVVAPATANLMAKMVHGFADDLASTILLAATCPVLLAPAMNPAMWSHSSTKRNVKCLQEDGIRFIGPEPGEMAEQDESGYGRMVEPVRIVSRIAQLLDKSPKPLTGLRAIVTAGPTHEPIDPLRYIANRSSGKQGYAIAAALAHAGARTILVSGPTNLNVPEGVKRIETQTAEEMRQATEEQLPADIAVMTAAVSDWRFDSPAREKIKKKTGGKTDFSLNFTENSDILKMVGHHEKRPPLVVGFAAETENITENAKIKLNHKGSDWIVANDVSSQKGVMGGENNTVILLTQSKVEEWPTMTKQETASRLVERIILHFSAEDRIQNQEQNPVPDTL